MCHEVKIVREENRTGATAEIVKTVTEQLAARYDVNAMLTIGSSWRSSNGRENSSKKSPATMYGGGWY